MSFKFTKPTDSKITRGVQALLSDLGARAIGIKGFAYDAAVSVTIPSFADGGASTSSISLVNVTATGVAVGDSVLTADPTQALPTNAIFLGAYVSAADVVTFVFTNAAHTAVTGAAKTFTLVVADRT